MADSPKLFGLQRAIAAASAEKATASKGAGVKAFSASAAPGAALAVTREQAEQAIDAAIRPLAEQTQALQLTISQLKRAGRVQEDAPAPAQIKTMVGVAPLECVALTLRRESGDARLWFER